jgi:hypothetical protein
VGDDLVAFVEVGDTPSGAPGSGEVPGVDVSPAAEGERTMEVRRVDGTAWSSEPGSSPRIGEATRSRCSGDGAEVYSMATDQVVASWVPAQGWRRPSTPDREAPSPIVGLDDRAAVFIQVQDGSILAATLEGYEPTPLSLPVLPDPGTGPLMLTVDAPDGIVVGCVSRLEGLNGSEGGTTGRIGPNCNVAGRAAGRVLRRVSRRK